MMRTTAFDRLGPGALFRQVAETIRNAIRVGTYPPGSALPPEPALCQRLGVSRATLRRAVDDLVEEGLVYRRQGAGTYVAGVHVKVDLMELRGFVDELRSQGHEPVVKCLVRRIEPSTKELAARLHIDTGDPVIYIKRLLNSRGEALAISNGFYDYRTCWALMDVDPDSPMYEAMEDELGLDIAYAEQSIEPRLAGREESQLLGIGRRALLLHVERTTYLATGDPVHFGRISLRADSYKATMILRRRRRRRVLPVAWDRHSEGQSQQVEVGVE
jgi:GntR family transcriptional regulator